MATRPEELYEQDFYAWTRHQARELRRLKASRLNTDLDLDHLALEIRDLGSEQLFAIQSQTVRLIEHLLKLQHSRHEEPRRQWMISVNNARAEIEDRLTAALRKRLLASLPRQRACPSQRRAGTGGPRRARSGRCPTASVSLHAKRTARPGMVAGAIQIEVLRPMIRPQCGGFHPTNAGLNSPPLQ